MELMVAALTTFSLILITVIAVLAGRNKALRQRMAELRQEQIEELERLRTTAAKAHNILCKINDSWSIQEAIAKDPTLRNFEALNINDVIDDTRQDYELMKNKLRRREGSIMEIVNDAADEDFGGDV